MSKTAFAYERLRCVEGLGRLRANICSKIILAVAGVKSDLYAANERCSFEDEVNFLFWVRSKFYLMLSALEFLNLCISLHHLIAL